MAGLKRPSLEGTFNILTSICFRSASAVFCRKNPLSSLQQLQREEASRLIIWKYLEYHRLWCKGVKACQSAEHQTTKSKIYQRCVGMLWIFWIDQILLVQGSVSWQNLNVFRFSLDNWVEKPPQVPTCCHGHLGSLEVHLDRRLFPTSDASCVRTSMHQILLAAAEAATTSTITTTTAITTTATICYYCPCRCLRPITSQQSLGDWIAPKMRAWMKNQNCPGSKVKT